MLLLEPRVAADILCSPGGFTLPLWKGDKSSSYLHGSSQISRWLGTRICKMCPSTAYYWWQGWLGTMSQSEKSKDKVRQWGDRDFQSPRLCHGSCWQGCFPPRRKDPDNNQVADRAKRFWLLLVSSSSYELSPSPEKAIPGQVTAWSSARADVKRLKQGGSHRRGLGPPCTDPFDFPVSLGERRRVDKVKQRIPWHIDSFPCPNLCPQALCWLLSSAPNYTPGKMVNTERSDHISVKRNGKPSLVWTRLLRGKCFLWTRKVGGRKKPDFLKILCGDQHLNLAIQGLLIQCKWKIVTFAEERDSAQQEVAGCSRSRGLEPRGRFVFRSHVD